MSKFIQALTDTSGNGLTGKLVELVPKGGAYPSEVVASTSASGSIIVITDSGNGIYYTADGVLPAGDYDLYVEGAKETAESPFFHAEESDVLNDIVDNLTSTDTDKALSANQGKQINDKTIGNTASGTDLSTSNKVLDVAAIINDLTTGGTGKPLSAAQGVALKALIDALASKTPGSGLESEGTNQLAIKYLVDTFYVDEDTGYFGILQEFSNQQILLNNKTLIQNLERLQSRILQLSADSSGNGVRYIYCDTVEDETPSGTLSEKIYTGNLADDSEGEFKKIIFEKREGETYLKIDFYGKKLYTSAYNIGIIGRIYDADSVLQLEDTKFIGTTDYSKSQLLINIASLTDNSIYSLDLVMSVKLANVGYVKNLIVSKVIE